MTAAKLEKVEGKLVWSLEIAPAKAEAVQHIEVDAMTGRIAGREGKALTDAVLGAVPIR